MCRPARNSDCICWHLGEEGMLHGLTLNRRCLPIPQMARPSPRPSRRLAQPTRPLWSHCTACLVLKVLRRCRELCIAAVVFLTPRAHVLLCRRVQVAVAASDSTGDRRAHAASSARQHPSVAWPDATGDSMALEHADVLHAEAASAVQASHASEIELTRQPDDGMAQPRRAMSPAAAGVPLGSGAPAGVLPVYT